MINNNRIPLYRFIVVTRSTTQNVAETFHSFSMPNRYYEWIQQRLVAWESVVAHQFNYYNFCIKTCHESTAIAFLWFTMIFFCLLHCMHALLHVNVHCKKISTTAWCVIWDTKIISTDFCNFFFHSTWKWLWIKATNNCALLKRGCIRTIFCSLNTSALIDPNETFRLCTWFQLLFIIYHIINFFTFICILSMPLKSLNKQTHALFNKFNKYSTCFPYRNKC